MEIDREVYSVIENYYKNGNWRKIENVLNSKIKKKGAHPLYVIYYAISLYYQRKYQEALVYSTRALKRDSQDPFILYHHGIILMHNKKFNSALSMWHKILSFPKIYLTSGRYGDGKKWAHSLSNDILYYIATTLFYKNDLGESIRFYRQHLKKRKRGIASFKTKKQVEKDLAGAIFLRNYEKKYPEKALPILEQ